MTLKDILDKINHPNIFRITWRALWTYPDSNIVRDDYIGECAYIDGKLIPLDGDSYDINAEIAEYDLWFDYTKLRYIMVVKENCINTKKIDA